jgi:N-acetylmuramic acid 6-phosphate etherase
VARSLRDGGRLIYVGAGSSGRIAALDSSECPPTYSTAPGQVQYIMAGGPKALASAVEVNEDSEELGQRDIARRRPTRKDVVVGLSASGRTPYVVAAVAYARARGAHTAAVTCNHDTPLAAAADIAIVADVGAEVISGSTRMKAGSAQKMVLNMITTGAMTRLGYVYENLMVNVHMQNSKLVERGIRILMGACKIDRATAVQTIKSAGRSVPVALVMLKAGSTSRKRFAGWQSPTAMCGWRSRIMCWSCSGSIRAGQWRVWTAKPAGKTSMVMVPLLARQQRDVILAVVCGQNALARGCVLERELDHQRRRGAGVLDLHRRLALAAGGATEAEAVSLTCGSRSVRAGWLRPLPTSRSCRLPARRRASLTLNSTRTVCPSASLSRSGLPTECGRWPQPEPDWSGR